jgi:CheY-like chemotaxis protein
MPKSLHILVVDDDPNMRRTLGDILTISGHQVEVSASPLEGLLQLEKTAFDCVVSDIRMPGMNGVEFLQAIRQKYGHLPVVLMTAYADQNLLLQARAQGLRYFLEKPLELERLFAWLAEVSAEPELG